MYLYCSFLAAVAVALLSLAPSGATAQPGTIPPSGADHHNATVSEVLSTSVRFTPNRGWIADTRGSLRPDVLYSASLGRVQLFLGANRFSYVFASEPTDRAKEFARHDWIPNPARRWPTDLPDGTPHPDSMLVRRFRMDLELVGANPTPIVQNQQPVPGVSNFYLAHCPAGILGVPSYQRLVYLQIYPRIDLVIASGEHGAKFDFVVHPGGRVQDIRMRYVGASSCMVTSQGSLHVANPLGTIEETAPYTYQGVLGDDEHRIASRYSLNNGVLGFDVAAFDSTQDLVIDPSQEWATFWGGSKQEGILGGNPTTIDRDGNVLVVGYTMSNDAYLATPGAFDISNPSQDALITKFDRFGNLVFSTFYGGNDDELAHGVGIDAYGNVYVTGHTFSTNLPTLSACQPSIPNVPSHGRDAFAAKFGPLGDCVWSTYSGGEYFDDSYACAVDSVGNFTLAITSSSSGLTGARDPVIVVADKPTESGNSPSQYDVMVVRYSPEGRATRMWWYGGAALDFAYGAGLDPKGNFLVTGWTSSKDLPLLQAAQPSFGGGQYDAFVATYDSNGALTWATYLGGSGQENGDLGNVGSAGVVADNEGYVFVTGSVTGGAFPTTSGAVWPAGRGGIDAFLASYDPRGVLRWATYFGGAGDDYGSAVTANNQGDILFCGYTAGTDLPVTGAGQEPPFQAVSAGGLHDACIARFDYYGRPTWVTYMGGAGDDQANGIAADPLGSIVVVGSSTSARKPFAARSQHQINVGQALAQANNNGREDLFITKFCDLKPARISWRNESVVGSDTVRTLAWVGYGYWSVKWYRLGSPVGYVGEGDSIEITEPGLYHAIVESMAGCTASTDTLKVARPQDAGEEITQGATVGMSGLRVIHDPAHEQALVEYELHGPAVPCLSLVDVSGRVVLARVQPAQQSGTYHVGLSLAGIPSGLYFVVLRAGAKQLLCRISVWR